MDPIFTEEQLNRMSRDDMLSLVKIMQGHYQKQKEALEKQETRIQLLEEKTKELEFLNAMLSDRLTLAQRKRFGASSEKYANGYAQMNLFNEAEQEADPNAPEPDLEEVHPSSYKRKKRSGKKEEDLSSFETNRSDRVQAGRGRPLLPGLQYEIQGCHKGNRKTAEIRSRTV